MTITDVAREANVSKSTVSLVLQGSPLIARDTAERVRQATEALGYVYNRRAADLRRKSTKVIGIVINDLLNPFFAELLVGMERRLADAGYISLMAHTDERLDVQEKVLTSMREYNAAGLILCPAFDTPSELLEAIRAAGTPLVITVRPVGTGEYDFVGADHERGTMAATRHLIEQGHRRIAFLGRIGGGPVYERRLAGYRGAMRERNLPVAAEWIVDIALTRDGGRWRPSGPRDEPQTDGRGLLQRCGGLRRDERGGRARPHGRTRSGADRLRRRDRVRPHENRR